MKTSPMPRLVLGLVGTLLTVAVFALYGLAQLDGLRQLQKNTIDKNRADSLQLLRIQNTLNYMGATLAHTSTARHQTASWQAEFRRMRADFEAALRIENSLVVRPENGDLLAAFEAFWCAADELVRSKPFGPIGNEEYKALWKLELMHHGLIDGVSELLVRNQQAEANAVKEIAAIYDGVERNVYLFTAAMLFMLGTGGAALLLGTRNVFAELKHMSEQRSTLAKKLIGVQEEVFRSVARELHDQFGQILTALGAMLRRVERASCESKRCSVGGSARGQAGNTGRAGAGTDVFAGSPPHAARRLRTGSGD
jgi:signal transduction histidine kinase